MEAGLSGSPASVTGAAQHTRIWTASGRDFTPRSASPVPNRAASDNQARPETGGGFVTWESYGFSGTDLSLKADKSCFWNCADGHAWEVNPTSGATLTRSVGGWFVWIDDRPAAPIFFGIRRADIGLP
jgi:hypothetical protein